MPQDDSKYSKPELREGIKDRVMAGSKGGKPGQWSARKAQLVAQQYEESRWWRQQTRQAIRT
jgi:hypothetical protein